MKVRTIMKTMLAVMLLCMSFTPMMAQKNIDKLFSELEKLDDVSVNSVTKRDPKTRLIVSMVKSFTLKDIRVAKRLIEAFEKDEEYAVTAIKDMPKGRKSALRVNFNFIFRTSDSRQYTYTLTTKEDGTVSATCIIKSLANGNRNFSYYYNDDISMDLVANTIETKNGCMILEGDVWIDGKKMKKGTYNLKGRKVIVK